MNENKWARMIVMALGLGVLAVFMAAYGCAQEARYTSHGNGAVLNDLRVTPGAVDKELTAEKLCNPKFHTVTARHVTQSMKVHACQQYGVMTGCPGKGYEIDHLISIELGGSNDPTNLWPQPVDTATIVGFHTKDVVENRAHALVCSGKISLADAQRGISTDWYQFGMAYGLITKK